MPKHAPRPSRPRLNGPIFAFALADIFGLACVGIGASWFVAGKGALIANFPNSAAEAVACAAGGGLVMIWAIGRILRELASLAPTTPTGDTPRLASQHPDKPQRTENSD